MMSKVEKRAREEFEQACTEYLDALYAGALTLTRSNVEAEELVQDTYVKAFRFAHKLLLLKKVYPRVVICRSESSC